MLIPCNHVVCGARDNSLCSHHLIGELLHVPQADAVPVPDEPFAQRQSVAYCAHGLVTAGRYDAVRLPEQFPLKRLITTVPFRDLE